MNNPTHDVHTNHAKRDNCNGLKINKDSHFIKKSPSSSSTSSLANPKPHPQPPQQRHPVIIYTHSPKVIHTHPRDFMALVQKLTGLSRSDENDSPGPQAKPLEADADVHVDDNIIKNNNSNSNSSVPHDDNDSSSVITDENCSSGSGRGGGGGGDIGQVINSSSSCGFVPPIFEHQPNHPYNLPNIPLFTPNSAEFLCPNNNHVPFNYNYTDSLFFTPNIRTSSISPTSTLDAIADFRDF